MSTIDEIAQQLHEKENELFAANREISNLQSQLDESRNRESHLATESQGDSIRNNERIRFLTQHHEEVEAELRETASKLRQSEETRKMDEANSQRTERELRIALLDVHNKESDLLDVRMKLQVFQEAQVQCEGLKKRVAELEEMQRESKEDFRAKATRVAQLEEALEKSTRELDESRAEARMLRNENGKLADEVTELASRHTQMEPQPSAKPVLLDSGRVTPENDGESTQRNFSALSTKFLGGGVDIGNSYASAYHHHDDHEEYLETPRRGSTGEGFSEPLLKDATMAGVALHQLVTGGIDKETQTLSQMGSDDDETKPVGCPKECAIC